MIELFFDKRVIHALIEAWPVSSSWHMEHLFHLTEQQTKHWHTYLIPSYVLLAVLLSVKKQFFCIKTYILAIVPAALCYFSFKSEIANPIVLNDATTHLLGALCLFIAPFFTVGRSILTKQGLKKLIYSVGLFQCLAIAIPGLSRLSCSFLALGVQRASLLELVLVSFTLQAFQASLWAVFLGFQVEMLPAGLLIAQQVAFLSGVWLFVTLGSAALVLSAAYRMFWVWFLA